MLTFAYFSNKVEFIEVKIAGFRQRIEANDPLRFKA